MSPAAAVKNIAGTKAAKQIATEAVKGTLLVRAMLAFVVDVVFFNNYHEQQS